MQHVPAACRCVFSGACSGCSPVGLSVTSFRSPSTSCRLLFRRPCRQRNEHTYNSSCCLVNGFQILSRHGSNRLYETVNRGYRTSVTFCYCYFVWKRKKKTLRHLELSGKFLFQTDPNATNLSAMINSREYRPDSVSSDPGFMYIHRHIR